MCQSPPISITSRIGFKPSKVRGNCYDCGCDTTNRVSLVIWYYDDVNFMCESCVRLIMEDYPGSMTDGQLDEDPPTPSYGDEEGETDSVLQALFERAMQPVGVLFDVAEESETEEDEE